MEKMFRKEFESFSDGIWLIHLGEKEDEFNCEPVDWAWRSSLWQSPGSVA